MPKVFPGPLCEWERRRDQEAYYISVIQHVFFEVKVCFSEWESLPKMFGNIFKIFPLMP